MGMLLCYVFGGFGRLKKIIRFDDTFVALVEGTKLFLYMIWLL